MRLGVVQHEDGCPLGLFADWWHAAGVTVAVARPYRGEALPRLEEVDGLVVLGGSMGATDDDRHPWLAPTRDLLARAVDAGRPTLGVCLGHQLLAVACGGAVARNPAGKQKGVLPVGSTPDGDEDALIGRLPGGPDGGVPVSLQWNDDVVVEVPPGATLLARTPDGVPQAMRVGEAWGVQFHPEVDVPIVRAWAEEEGPVTPDDEVALAAMAAAGPALEATGRAVALTFAAIADERRARNQPKYRHSDGNTTG